MHCLHIQSCRKSTSTTKPYVAHASPPPHRHYQHRTGSECNTFLKDGFWDVGKKNMYDYCGNLGTGAISLHRNGGLLNNLDIDCDGLSPKGGDCYNDPSPQNQMAFGWKAEELSGGAITELDAKVHPYMVFGNEGLKPVFNPRDFGMPPLGVMAVVCNHQVHYGVWGDTNYGTSTGEASLALALAKLCFPNEGLNGNKGHDVVYVGFRKQSSQPTDANWVAKDAATFEARIKTLGDQLVNGLPSV